MASSNSFLLTLLLILIVCGFLVLRFISKYQSGKRSFLERLQRLLPSRPSMEQDLESSAWVDKDRESHAHKRLAMGLFIAGLMVYLSTRFVGLDEYPAHFFTDEAAQTVFASELIRDRFVYEGELLPTYFFNVDKYSLSVTVYLQLIPYLLFGKSVVITRGASALVTILGVVAICLLLKHVFQIPHWWLGTLLLSTTPVWFLQSRTAFENAIAVSFYALFIYAYYLYLYRSSRFWYLTLIAGALTFYTYNPARLVVVATGLFFLLSDIKYHWQNRRLIVTSSWLILLLVLPFVRFQKTHILSELDQLELLQSYWVEDLTVGEKLLRFGQEIFRGLNPVSWFIPNRYELVWPPQASYIMMGYGHLLWIMLPFMLGGLVYSIKRFQISAYRNLILISIASPFGAALVEVNTVRVLFILVPMMVYMTLGLTLFINKLESRISRKRLALLVFAGFAGFSLFMTREVLTRGPARLGVDQLRKMQRVAEAVYDEIDTWAEKPATKKIIVTTNWPYSTSIHARFYSDDIDKILFGGIDVYLDTGEPIRDDMLFVMLPSEYLWMASHVDVESYSIKRTISCPDGQPCFYFVTLDRKTE